MELYVGMDVSLKQTSICVVDGKGEIVSEGTVTSEPAAIAEFIESKAKEAVRIGLETGPTTTWLWHALRALGLPVICIDARHAKAALSLQINKSDRNDAVGLARIMRAGWYKEVQVKSLPCHEVRALLSNLGYQVMEAATGAAALEQLGTTTRVNLLLTDVVLPGGMNGRELATEIERCTPAIKVLYMSGYTEDAIMHHGRLDADADLLQKPFRRAGLALAVRRVLDGPPA